MFKNLSLSIFLRFSVNDIVYYHISQTLMNYVRYLVNINCLELKDISSSHIQVWNSDRVRFLPQRKWSDRNELYLESQVSEGNPSSEGICQSDKEWASPGMEGVASSFWAGCFSEFPSGHSFTIVCTKQCKSWEGGGYYNAETKTALLISNSVVLGEHTFVQASHSRQSKNLLNGSKGTKTSG